LPRWQEQGYPGAATIAAMPPPLLDDISADLLLACDPETGNNLLAHYIFEDKIIPVYNG
jgi:hypothetical protein